MNKFLNIVFIFSLFIIASTPAYTDCFVGSACSISDLENEQAKKTSNYIEFLDTYFNKRISDKLFFNSDINELNYNNLFVFKNIV